MDRISSHIGAVSIFVTGVAIIGSVLFNFSYFGVIGEKMFTLMSFSDYVVSMLAALPSTVIGLVIGSVAGDRISSVLNVSRDDNSPKAEKRRSRASFIASLAFGLVVGIFLGSLTRYILFGGVLLKLLILVCGWSILLVKLGFLRKLSIFESQTITMCVLFFSAAYVLGESRGIADMTKDVGDYTIQTSSKLMIDNVIILRNMDKGILIRTPENQEKKFILWGNVRNLSVSKNPPQNTNRMCQWFELFCDDTTDQDASNGDVQ
jgi:hypothetical protein